MFHSYFDSPIGSILMTGNSHALTGLYTAEHVRLPSQLGSRDDELFRDCAQQLAEYFDGARTEFDLVLEPVGTDFQRRVWMMLAQIPYGQVRSYGQLAALIDKPTAARAVGLANSRNPISIILPCHRVIGSTGALTGYAGGLATKRWLLQHEGSIAELVPA